ncbi:hypothetical protein S83_054589 [Arachis hypogaea]
MDDFETDALYFSGEGSNGDFCDTILSRFSGSPKESHLHLCAVIGAMSGAQGPKSPLLTCRLLGAACSSLDRISVEPNPPSHVTGALLTVISSSFRECPLRC